MNKTILFLITTLIAIFVVVSTPSKSLADSTTNCNNIYRNLYFGTRGNDVSVLQHFLNERGYFSGNFTGYFGYMTYRSVVKWQRSEGINAIGVVGPQTRKRLGELCTNPDLIPVDNFVPTNSCKSWFDGCNECARSTIGGPAACTQRACFAAGKGYCKGYFESTNTICTMEYAPVCGQPAEPACRRSNPACMIPTPGPETYSNSCMLFADGATYLYGGVCN